MFFWSLRFPVITLNLVMDRVMKDFCSDYNFKHFETRFPEGKDEIVSGYRKKTKSEAVKSLFSVIGKLIRPHF